MLKFCLPPRCDSFLSCLSLLICCLLLYLFSTASTTVHSLHFKRIEENTPKWETTKGRRTECPGEKANMGNNWIGTGKARIKRNGQRTNQESA